MKITFLGTGTCVQHTDNRAQSSILVESSAGKEKNTLEPEKSSKIIIDSGPGTLMRLNEIKLSVNDIDAVLITHNHLDHNGDLLAILKARWLQRGPNLKIFGPNGTDEFLNSILEAYPYLKGKLEFDVEHSENFEVDEFLIKAIPTYHSIVSRAYVIKNKNKKIVISGDTRPFNQLIGIKCSVLIHELSLPFNSATVDHTTPEAFAECLRHIHAKKICLTHIYPHTFKMKNKIIDYLSRFTDAEILVPVDLDALTA